MKKYLPIIFIIFILLLYLIKDKEITKSIFFEEENNFYEVYNIEFNNISFTKYKQIFDNIEEDKYKILNYKFINNYNKEITAKINNIKIEGGSYLEALDEYINKYLSILEKYDIESEISKIKNANMLIKEIKIYTTKDIYNTLKKDAYASKFSI